MHDLFHSTLRHDMPPVLAGTRADIHQIVRGPQGILIMLHDDQGIAQIPQILQGGQQLGVVTLMQADGRFIQYVQHAHQPGADLGGQPDALGLTARQGGSGPGQRQIGQPHIAQEAQPVLCFFQYLIGNEVLGL